MEKNEISFRYSSKDDLEALYELDKDLWGDLSASWDQWQSRLNIWPNGTFIAEQGGRLVGAGVPVIISWSYSHGAYPTWEAATDNGYIRNHDPVNGDTVFGVDFSVRPEVSRVAARILMEMKNIQVKMGLKYIRAGYRAPFLAQFAKDNPGVTITPELVRRLSEQDGLIKNLFFALGWTILDCAPGYFARDKDSLGWGVIMDLKV